MVNYDDPRLTQIDQQKQDAISNVEKVYGDAIGATDQKYDALIDESKAWAEEQKKQQQAQTDFALEKIGQQKEQAHKDYLKEQSGAYVDWQKQSNQYGVAAEQMAAAGLKGSGYSESAQVSMYNTYQNRVATAKQSYSMAVINYDNAMKEATLQNSAVLAQIAHDALQKQLELALEGFQYKNNLLLEQANKKFEVDQAYHSRYMDVLNQINTENRLAQEQQQFEAEYALKQQQFAESVRQFDAERAQRQKEYEESVRQYNANYDMKMKEYNEDIRQYNETLARLKEEDEKANKLAIQEIELKKEQLEHDKAQLEEEKRQFNENLLEEQRQFDAKLGEGTGGGIIEAPISTGGVGKLGDGNNQGANPSINKASWSAVEKKFGGKISESEMAAYVANGMVDMRIGADGVAYFTVPVRLAKSGAMVDIKD